MSSYELFVCNYPRSFSKKDVENLFRDYKGMILNKFFEKDGKCFSFISCVDLEQAMLVIEEKHNSNVNGRRLVVRASNKDLQSYIELLLKDKRNGTSSEKENSRLDPSPIKNNTSHQAKFDRRSQHSAGFNNKYNSKNEASHEQTLDHKSPRKEHIDDIKKYENHMQVSRNKVPDQRKHECKTQYFKSPRNESYQNDSREDSLHHKNMDFNNPCEENRRYAAKKEVAEFVPFKVNRNETLNWEQFPNEPQNSKSFNNDHASSHSNLVHELESLKLSPRRSEEGASPNFDSRSPPTQSRGAFDEFESLKLSPGRSEEGASLNFNSRSLLTQPRGAFDEFGWVCVANFPFETTIGDLYRLFTDYNPLKVYIRYDVPVEEGVLTQALVLFSDQDTADDVILNFDNTLYRGHIVLVSDVTDSSITNELLAVSHA